MSFKFRTEALTPVEVSFLQWQYGFDDGDDAYARVLWQAIGRAWEADAVSGGASRHLERLGAPGAYPEEVALYISFRRAGGDALWNDLLRRAGLADRRKRKEEAPVERRRKA